MVTLHQPMTISPAPPQVGSPEGSTTEAGGMHVPGSQRCRGHGRNLSPALRSSIRAFWPQSPGCPLLTQLGMPALEIATPSQATHFLLYSEYKPQRWTEIKTHLCHFLCDLTQVSGPLCASGASNVKGT